MRALLASALITWTCAAGAAAEPRREAPAAPGQAAQAPPAGALSRYRPPDTGLLRVGQVIDGDTITVSGVGTVRLIGVDAPEKTGGRRQSEPFGDAAARFMRDLVAGKLVRLEYDGARKDDYGRTLAYVFLEDGTLANDAIIRAGFAETYRRFTYRRKAAFQAAEDEARGAHRGMWGARAPAARRRRP